MVLGREKLGRQVPFHVPLKSHYLGTNIHCLSTKPVLSEEGIKVEEGP